MENFNEETQRAKVKAGFKGGPFFGPLALQPALSIVDGVPSSVRVMQQNTEVPSPKLLDPWVTRYPNGKVGK